jgi:hypothetical protein
MGENFFHLDLLANESMSRKNISGWEMSDRGIQFVGQLTFALEILAIVIIFIFLSILIFKMATGPYIPGILFLVLITVSSGFLLCIGVYLTLNFSIFTKDSTESPSRSSKLFVDSFRDSWNQFRQEPRLRRHLVITAFLYITFAILPTSTFFLFFFIFSSAAVLKMYQDRREKKVIDSDRQRFII